MVANMDRLSSITEFVRMTIKVVCITKSEGEHHRRIILELSSTAAHLITVADRFLPLHQEHALANGPDFVNLECLLDEHQVQTRYLIENASTVFFLLKERMFKDNGFAVFKHEADVECFMKMVRHGQQPICMPPPKWLGPSFIRTKVKSGKAPMVPKAEMPQIVASVADEAARLTQAALPGPSPLEPSLAESPKPRRMKSNNMRL
jgi:hypothetical protein